MKRIMTFCLAIVMVLAIAGCKDKTSETPVTTPGSGDETRSNVTISIGTADETTFNPAKDELAKFIQDKFGITFDVSYIEDTAQYVLMATSDELPDVMYNEPLYFIANYISMIEQGFFKDIPQSLIDKYPNISNIIATSNICTATKELYGGNYLLPKPDSMDRNLYIAERRGIFYRKDWAAKFGITSRPTNMEDFYTMAKHFTFDDPDGNGKQDTWGFSTPGGGDMRIWFSAWGIDATNWVKDTDGSWTHGMFLKSNLVPLNFFRKMYQEGILDPEFSSINYVQAMQKLASGTVGSITRNADADWIKNVIVEQVGAANPGKDPFEMIDLIPIMAKDANSNPYMHEYMLDMCGTQFNSKITDEKLDRYLEFHNWVMSEEGQSYKLGFEGKEWKRDANGKYEIIPTSDGKYPVIADLYPSAGLLNMPSWGFELYSDPDWPLETYGQYATQIRALDAEARALRNPNAMPINMSVKLISSPSKLEADTFNWSREVVTIITGTESVEALYDAMLQKALDSGYRQAIEDVNAYVKEHNIQ